MNMMDMDMVDMDMVDMDMVDRDMVDMEMVDKDVVDMDMVDMDMVDMDIEDMEIVDMDMVDRRNVTQRNLSHSWIRWTTGHGHSVPRKRSIAIVHYWVRHAKCTWSSFSCPSSSIPTPFIESYIVVSSNNQNSNFTIPTIEIKSFQ